MSGFAEELQKQLDIRSSRQAIDDQLFGLAKTFLASFPGLEEGFEDCVTAIAVAVEMGCHSEANQAMGAVSLHLKKAEEAWQSPIMQELKTEAHRDIARVLRNPKELRVDVVDLPVSNQPEAVEAIDQLRACAHCLDAVQAALARSLGDEYRVKVGDMYPAYRLKTRS